MQCPLHCLSELSQKLRFPCDKSEALACLYVIMEPLEGHHVRLQHKAHSIPPAPVFRLSFSWSPISLVSLSDFSIPLSILFHVKP